MFQEMAPHFIPQEEVPSKSTFFDDKKIVFTERIAAFMILLVRQLFLFHGVEGFP